MKLTGFAAPLSAAALCLLAACGGGGGGGNETPAPPPPPASVPDQTFATPQGVSHFLAQATFGPTHTDIQRLSGRNSSDWLLAEFAKPATLNVPYVRNRIATDERNDDGSISFFTANAPTDSFWINAISADDQLRQRVAFALSEIFVISHVEGGALHGFPEGVATYMDVLVRNAFGNYRTLLEEVTYAPAMGEYLTYLQNQKGNPETGQMPDENYAREVMQLFTIGLVELNADGTPRLGPDGQVIETYTNSDVTGLARVFTGLSLDTERFFYDSRTLPDTAKYGQMRAFPRFHSELEKRFLNVTIPPNTPPTESIDAALDGLFNHPNVAPFIGKQLIQRLVTSNPSPAYVSRVSAAFNSGRYSLPDGRSAGTGERGDMQATIAAILMDEEARSLVVRANSNHGKIREPIIRFVHWARAFNARNVTPEELYILFTTSQIGQAPYKAPSVFNFFRPGYQAPGTETGAAGLALPELQIMNANTVAGYANFMSYWVFEGPQYEGEPEQRSTLRPDYSSEMAIATDPAALVARLDLVFTAGALQQTTRDRIVSVLNDIPIILGDAGEADARRLRVAVATFMIQTAPEYIVQR